MTRSRRSGVVLGIDGSNIREGGGVTHLIEMLRAANPSEHGFEKVIVWSSQATLDRVEDRTWLVKCHQPLLDRGLFWRAFWQRWRLSSQARKAHCDVLFIPGGTYVGDFRPVVIFSQNLLPFAWRELSRYGWSWMALKFALLHLTQTSSFRRADGLIFLTQFARDAVLRVIGPSDCKMAIVPHGIDERFVGQPRAQLAITHYSVERPFRILYVSHIDVYKHQWHAAEAVAQLRANGMPVTLELIGRAYPPALRRLKKTLDRIDPRGDIVRYTGVVPYEELHTRYAQADLFLFASSCETFGQILTEAMGAGLPIACSNRSAMPELLAEGGVYFDPENSQEIVLALRKLIESPELRSVKSKASFERAQAYSWRRCANETFGFLATVVGSAKGW